MVKSKLIQCGLRSALPLARARKPNDLHHVNNAG